VRATGAARPTAVAAHTMVATSHPLATQAGLRTLKAGGNAVDAGVAAAAVQCVTEPWATGLGGDLFAIVWRDAAAHGLDSAGCAPAAPGPTTPVEDSGPRSVDVPGTVAGLAELCARHGTLGLERCLQDAIVAAERGFAVGTHGARLWGERDGPPAEIGPIGGPGAVVRMPELAATLRAVARDGPDAFYRGPVAEAIVAASWLSEDDLAAHAPRWVEPLRLDYHGTTVLEIPPPTQGVAALEGLGLLDALGGGFAARVTAVRLALEDAFAHVRDGADVGWLLEPERLATRAAEAPAAARGPRGGTSYLCVVDEDGMAVSLIHSLFANFGSGVVAGDTGVLLNNRAACFAIAGEVTPGVRPYHTILPGLLLRDGELLGPFGVMGGFIQAQAHVQFVSSVVDDGLDPQQALDRPRFLVSGDSVALERGLWDEAPAIEALGLRAVRETAITPFGGGQAIVRDGGALVGGSDVRKDGYAAGY
jgi:gamma-glutamyltranspeptidase / glutathione hydrolase